MPCQIASSSFLIRASRVLKIQEKRMLCLGIGLHCNRKGSNTQRSQKHIGFMILGDLNHYLGICFLAGDCSDPGSDVIQMQFLGLAGKSVRECIIGR
jgi:hypothetical protein